MDPEDMTQQTSATCIQPPLYNHDLTAPRQDLAPRRLGLHPVSNGTCEVETMVALHCPGDGEDLTADGEHPALRSVDMSQFSNSDLSLPEVCISTNSNSVEEDDMNHEVQQAYRIFTGFLLDKHKAITSPLLHPIGHQEAQRGIGGVRGRGQAQLRQSACLRRIEEKFLNHEFETITEFVADFRMMLENCYRYHGVDHWISKQAQKLEIMLEQKLTLLSRTLREKTSLSVTSRGRFGAEEERASGGTSTRRRLAPRSLATMTVGGHESIMVQALRLEEQHRAKEEKRQRELEKKEAEETSAKEVEEWEQSLLSQASPRTVDALWELPAIGHFLCLAQTALNLPEIVFFELERCLLMPRCSLLLSKIMSSLLTPPQRRPTLQRRPALPYRRWESELRQRVATWYQVVGASRDHPGRAEQLGLCHQFFCTLGDVCPLEEKPFHLLPFYQRVWLLKGLCDNVYETQKCVQDAVLAQPIHECRESILGYDSKENAYIHFPHFCGADLRIYCQSPCTPPAFPFPSVWVKRLEMEPGTEGDASGGIKAEGNKGDREYYAETFGIFKRENGDDGAGQRFKLWTLKDEEASQSGSASDRDSCEGDSQTHTNPIALSHTSPSGRSCVKKTFKEESAESERLSKRLAEKRERGSSSSSMRTIDAETQEPCLSVGEHSYTGRSPARSLNLASPTKTGGLKMEAERGHAASCLGRCRKTGGEESEGRDGCCGPSEPATRASSESPRNSSAERPSDQIWTKKRKRRKKRGREQLPRVEGAPGQLQHVDRMRPSPAEAAKSPLRRVATTARRKDKKKKQKTGTKLESSKKITDESPVEPSFKLVCTSLEELRGLISKTEDELDDLESTQKRPGRWFNRRQAVKDLHSTLIRLLNELSPWEPKLVKAYQRNRLRLKKEFDDFKKHPEYDNFVREEFISSSSSDEDEEGVLGKEAFSLTDPYRRSEEEDLEHKVPRGLWSGASAKEFGDDAAGETTSMPPIRLKQSPASPERVITLPPRVQRDGTNVTSAAESGPESRSERIPSNRPMASDSARTAEFPGQAPLSPRPTILHPTTGLPKGYTPIPTLLAKSVGNKVTLMKRPADRAGLSDVDGRSRGSSTSAAVAARRSKAHTSSGSQRNSPQTQAQGQQQTRVHRQLGKATLLNPPQAKPLQGVPTSPAHSVCRVPERPGRIVGKDSSSVHSVTNHNTGEKVTQQVLILAPNVLIHRTEEKAASPDQHQSKVTRVPVSGTVAAPSCLSAGVPGFTFPENRIPVQQVAPLKDARTPRSHSQGALNASGFKGAQICSPQAATPHGVTCPSGALPAEPVKSAAPRQELKTVCIRDSQSILVTTRGGNTGIVKVQASSDHGGLGSFPASPVITISPQFKAFLVSKTQATFTPSAPSQTSPCASPAPTSVSAAQPRKQVPSPLNSLATLATPETGSIPTTGPGSQAAGAAVASTQSSNTAACPAVAKTIGQLAHAAAAASHFQAPLLKNAVSVPSPSNPGVPRVLAQPEVSKTGVKRVVTDERSQVTKFILVTPSSSPASSVASSKGLPPSSAATPLPGSRVMFVSQPTATSSTAFIGRIPKPAMAAGAGGQLLTASPSSPTLKMGPGPGQPIPPSGVPAHLSGKTTAIGRTIGALSCSPSGSVTPSVSDSLCPSTTAPGLFPVPVSSAIAACSAQLASRASLTASSSPRGTRSFGTVSQTGAAASASAAWSSPTHTGHTATPVRQQSNSQSGTGEETSLSPSSTLALNKTHASLFSSTTASTGTPFAASATGPVQQRVVINTSAALAAGTQIILNGARFVVPPQGLGPGSHVLIISSPAPQQVPTVPGASAGASAPPRVATHSAAAPQPPVLAPSRLSGVPASTSPFVACPSALSLPRPVIPVPTPISLASAPLVAGAPLPSSPTGQPMVSATAACQQTAVRIAAPSAALAQALLHTGLGSTSVRKRVPAVMQPVLPGTRTQVLPTVAVPPVVSAVSRVQTLPVATVTPIGCGVNTFDTASVWTTPPYGRAAIISPAQPVTSLNTNSAAHPPVLLTSHALGKHSLQTPAFSIPTNVASKLLISPDGAVLSTAQCHVNPGELTSCPKPLEALVVFPNSTSGALHPHDSSLQPSQADAK